MKVELPDEIVLLTNNILPLFSGNSRRDMPKVPGIYAFWWKLGGVALPHETSVFVQGPNSTKAAAQAGLIPFRCKTNYETGKVSYALQQEGKLQGVTPPPYLPEGYVCLYVGKSTNVFSRVGSHVCANTRSRSTYLTYKDKFVVDDSIPHTYNAEGPDYILMKDTQSQFRAGLEYIFRHEDESYAFDRMKDSVYISSVATEGNTFRDRFYLEDLAIGIFHPWFNLDSER